MKTLRLSDSVADLAVAADLLRQDQTVVFPTETVFGIGANAFSPAAVDRIFAAKGRPADNPLIVHVADLAAVESVAQPLSPLARFLFERFSPGPLTVVVPRRPQLAAAVSAGLPTVAVRIPSHPVAQALLRQVGLPLAAPSANRSGRPSPTNAGMAWADLSGKVAAVIDGGVSVIGIESTVVLPLAAAVQILRPGSIGRADIDRALDQAGWSLRATGPLPNRQSPLTPGSRYRHYSPSARLIIVAADQVLTGFNLAEQRIGLVWPAQTAWPLGLRTSPNLEYLGQFQSLADYAANLYAWLRLLDQRLCDLGIFWWPADDGSALAAALRDRLARAAGLL